MTEPDVLELDKLPSLTAAYGKALLSRKPGLREGELIPLIRARARHVEVATDALRSYADVCGFEQTDELPLTYPQVLAMPIHATMLLSQSFPLSPVGVIHLRSDITAHAPIPLAGALDFECRLEGHRQVKQGIEIDLETTVEVSDKLVWQSTTAVLFRSGKKRRRESKQSPHVVAPMPQGDRTEVWDVPADIGRRYASVSGDYNPIHLSRPTARLFGFRKPIAHGLWSLARSLAALGNDLDLGLPSCPLRLQAKFKRPVLLPAQVQWVARREESARVFSLHSSDGTVVHLTGRLAPA